MSGPFHRTWLQLVMLTAALAGCHRAPAPPAAAPPRLDRLVPAEGDVSNDAVVFVVAEGMGFDTLNTVHFGELVLQQIPRLSPNTIRFMVPRDDAQRPGSRQAPPMALRAGRYDVSVRTARGESNRLVFTLLRSNHP